jgi:hypothetical protein
MSTNEHPVDRSRRDPATSRPMPPKRESDRLLERLRTLVHESRRGRGANSVELEARNREIEGLKAQLADGVKRTAATEAETYDRR